MRKLIDSLPLLESEKVGLDLEADSLHRYSERICLVQVSNASGEMGVFDPLEGDWKEFASRISGMGVWMHGADYDLTLMAKGWKIAPEIIWDTQIASRLLGARKFGYASLVEEYFGAKLEKGPQKADWGKRPLSEKMLNYALDDVRYLLPLAEKLEKKLRDKSRWAWFVESCKTAQRKVAERKEDPEPWRIKGSGAYDSKHLGILRELWTWRDKEARAWDRPPFMVARNKDLLNWVESLAGGRRFRTPSYINGERRSRLETAVEKSLNLKEEDWPIKKKYVRVPRNEGFESRLQSLIGIRNQAARDLAIEETVLAARATLESLANGEEVGLMDWQREVLGL